MYIIMPNKTKTYLLKRKAESFRTRGIWDTTYCRNPLQEAGASTRSNPPAEIHRDTVPIDPFNIYTTLSQWTPLLFILHFIYYRRYATNPLLVIKENSLHNQFSPITPIICRGLHHSCFIHIPSIAGTVINVSYLCHLNDRFGNQHFYLCNYKGVMLDYLYIH